MTAAKSPETSENQQNAMMQRVMRAAPDALSKLLKDANWQTMPLPVLAWAVSRKGICANVALHGFFSVDPMRFNYLHKAEVPEDQRALCRMLDALCLRLNSGFFRAIPSENQSDKPAGFDNWMACQRLDEIASRSGRWVIRESALIAPQVIRESAAKAEAFAELAEPEAQSAAYSLKQDDLKAMITRLASGRKLSLN